MKQFLAIYLGSATSVNRAQWDKLDEAGRKQKEQAGMQAWGQWMVEHQKSVVTTGGPLGKTKRVSPRGVEDTKNEMTGYVVLQAESHQAAAKMFENHPHFAIFPGDSIEVMECLPIPGQ
ncbi:MAG TPA: hypothetical protein VNA21_10260 [Steroidobacteraceae bacterium]|nr:hypothetical protein [Steroidobacteraceae bacterium]